MTFSSYQQVTEAIAKFDDVAVDDMVVGVKPFLEKGMQSERKDPQLLSKRVYLMNLPYDASVREVEALCKEFVPVENVVIPRGIDRRPRGHAFVYLKSAADVPKLIDFVDGRHIRSR